MTVLLQAEQAVPGVYEVDEAEQRALAALAEGGLVPPLRLVRPASSGSDATSRSA
jgi:hypothetical protein